MIVFNLKEFSLKSFKISSIIFDIFIVWYQILYYIYLYSCYYNYIDNCIIDKIYRIMYFVENNVNDVLFLV